MKVDYKKNKAICMKAWSELAISPVGLITPCCIFEKPLIENGKNISLKDFSLLEAWESKALSDIRQKMINGENIVGCEQCYISEKNNGSSKRLEEFSTWEKHRDDDFDFSKLNSSKIKKEDLISIDLKLQNKCNLACRMCQPKDSAFVSKQFDEIVSRNPEFEFYQNTILKDPILGVSYSEIPNWASEKNFRESLIEILPGLRNLNVAGGEPFLIDEFYDILEQIKKYTPKDQCTLFVSTNLSVLPENLYDLLQGFKWTQIGASVDGFEHELEYVRYPLKWKKFKENYETLLDRIDGKKITTSLCVTVQLYNVLSLDKLLNYYVNELLPKYKSDKVVIYLHLLTYPEHLNIMYLPKKSRLKVIERIEPYIEKINNLNEIRNRFAIDQLKQIVNIMKADVDENTLIRKNKEFLMYTTKLDEKRKQRFEDYLPELFSDVSEITQNKPEFPKPNPELLKSKAWEAIALGENKKAIKQFLTALSVAPNDWIIHRELGWLSNANGELEKSEQYHLKSLELNPDDEEGYLQLAYTYQCMKNKEAAVNILKKGLEHHQDNKRFIEKLNNL